LAGLPFVFAFFVFALRGDKSSHNGRIMEQENVLVIENVDKRFPGVQALKNVKIDLRAGEVHAVCGENGAGKSTLMKIICGVHKPDSGSMTLNGEPYSVSDPNDAYSRGIAIIFQESSLFPDLTVLENIFMGHEIMRPVVPFVPAFKMIDYSAMRERASAVFDRLGMDIDLDAVVAELGVATKQMVEIAKALTFDSQILILDEPTAALTSNEVDTLFATIRKLRGEGKSMLYISHRLDEVFEIADRVTVYRDGQYIETADVKNVSKDQLVAWMVGRQLTNLYPKTDAEIGETVLEVKDLFQEGVLDHIDLKLRRGEILGLAGLAGAGRTELALALCGLTSPDGGKVFLRGKQVKVADYRHTLERGIAYVSEDRQAYGLVLPMTLKTNITHKVLPSITNSIGIIDRQKESEVTRDFMKQLAIKAPDGEFVTENLSGGNQQKVSVAKSLAVEPDILILDEPTRGVDVGAKSEIHRIVSDLANAGKAIILISSDLPEILGMCDRVLVMKMGRITGELERSELSQEKVLSLAL
jgi:ABC-type sugar transport system ATPase subunit